jgi:hypothetical protein
MSWTELPTLPTIRVKDRRGDAQTVAQYFTSDSGHINSGVVFVAHNTAGSEIHRKLSSRKR